MRRSQDLKPIEIRAAGARGRAPSWFGFGLIVAAAAGAIGLLFARFTGSAVLAVTLVGIMLAYMGVMGWLAMRNIEGKR